MNGDDAQLIDSLVTLVGQHQWVPASSIVIGLLTRLTKTDVSWFPTVDARWRSFAAVMLGIADGVLYKVMAGGKWGPSLVGGLFAACLAISSHDVVIEGFRKGRELFQKKPPPGPPGSGQDVIVPPRESRRAPPLALTPPDEIDITDEGLAATVPSSFPKPTKVPPTFLVPLLLALACSASKEAAYGERAAACQLAVDKAYRDHVGRENCDARERDIVASGACKPGFTLNCPVILP